MAISIDLDSHSGRKQLIDQIALTENVKRKALSLRQTEIYGDYLFNHVWENIAGRFSAETAKQMPICAHINLARRIVKAEASIYKEEPLRSFSELSEEQEERMLLIYRDMMANMKFMRSNESFKLQQQNHIMIVPREGKLEMRVLKNHHIDKIDDDNNPEVAAGYVINNFDRTFFTDNRRRDNDANASGRFNQFTNQRNDAIDAVIGDEDDWKKDTAKYLVWTKEYNFIMNGKGNIISEFNENPIGEIPIVDISQEKDFKYWVNQGDAIVDATIDHNVTMSDIGFISQQTGFGQAYMISEEGSQSPENLQVGPNTVIRMEVGSGSDFKPEFGYATPVSDIMGSLEYANAKLIGFLTSRGLDPDVVTTENQGGDSSNSGVQEFLRMMKHFKATKEDYSTYENTEMKIYEVIKAWCNNAPELLNPKYQTGVIKEDSELTIQFAGPEMLQTEQEKVDVWQSKIDMGIASRIDALMAIEGLTREMAEERLEDIDKDDINGDKDTWGTDNKENKTGPDGDNKSDSEKES